MPLIGRADSQHVTEVPQPASAHAEAGGAGVVVARDLAGVRRHHLVVEVLKPVCLEPLPDDVDSKTERVLLVELHRDRRNDEHLREIDAGVRRAEETYGCRVRRVHSAVAEDRQPYRQVIAQRLAVAQLGHEEALLVVGVVEAVGLRMADDLAAAVGTEQVDAGVEPVTDESHARRVAAGRQRILGKRCRGAAHGLGLQSHSVREIAVGGRRRHRHENDRREGDHQNANSL